MSGFPQPRPKFAQNCKIAILKSLILYPVMKFLCLLFGCVKTQIWNLKTKVDFANMLKLSENQFLLQEKNCKFMHIFVVAVCAMLWGTKCPDCLWLRFYKVGNMFSYHLTFIINRVRQILTKFYLKFFRESPVRSP